MRMKRELAAYSAQAPALRGLIEGLDREALHAHPGPGEWSIAEVVAHLYDADLAYLDRFRRVIATGAPAGAAGREPPTLLGWDQSAYMREMPAAHLDVEAAATAFEAGRRVMIARLAALPEGVWQRVGERQGVGPGGLWTLAQLMVGCVEHFDHHAEFARKKRERLQGEAPRSAT